MSDIEEERKSPTQKLKEKEEKQMKNRIKLEAIKTWTIVLLIGLIAVSGTYLYAFNQGVEHEQSQASQVEAKAVELSAKLTSKQ